MLQEPSSHDFSQDEMRERELGLDNDHLYRLFVGWVPKLFTESDLQPLFEQVRISHALQHSNLSLTAHQANTSTRCT